MINLGMDGRPSTSATAEKALSFLSKGWREDLQLIRNRASSFKNLADRELENFLNYSSTTAVPISEFEFVKRIQPKLSEIRRAYSSPDFSRKVLERWSPRSTIRIDLSGIKKAIVSEVDDESKRFWIEMERDRVRRRRRKWRLDEEDWEPIRALKTRLKEFESESNEFVEKVKLSLVYDPSIHLRILGS